MRAGCSASWTHIRSPPDEPIGPPRSRLDFPRRASPRRGRCGHTPAVGIPRAEAPPSIQGSSSLCTAIDVRNVPSLVRVHGPSAAAGERAEGQRDESRKGPKLWARASGAASTTARRSRSPANNVDVEKFARHRDDTGANSLAHIVRKIISPTLSTGSWDSPVQRSGVSRSSTITMEAPSPGLRPPNGDLIPNPWPECCRPMIDTIGGDGMHAGFPPPPAMRHLIGFSLPLGRHMRAGRRRLAAMAARPRPGVPRGRPGDPPRVKDRLTRRQATDLPAPLEVRHPEAAPPAP
jgi:hypothetical protein